MLRGRDHAVVGGIATIAEGPVAVALSRGGAAKTYRHAQANEDAAAFAVGPAGAVLAVADGHGGWDAAETAIDHLLRVCAPAWTAAALERSAWSEAARAALVGAQAAILGAVVRGGAADARTTLAFALVRPADGWLGFASFGDSHVFCVDDASAHERAARGDAPAAFLGTPSHGPELLAGGLRCGSEDLTGVRALALATDGLSEPGVGVAAPARSVAEVLARARCQLPELRALALARGLIEEALAAHRRRRSGDNVASAVFWLG